MLTPEHLVRLPKAELHNHLDGSLRPGTIVSLAQQAGIRLPSEDPSQLARQMVVPDGAGLDEYLQRFDLTVAVLQQAPAIERVAYEMVEDAARDGVRYLEVRYCPHLSTHAGLVMEDVLEAELHGLARGSREFGVVTGVINCSLRHYEPERSEAIARVSVAFRDRGVVGFDLAGGEAGQPPGRHGAAFDIAARGCLGITVHAGEAAGPESIAEALVRCHANRIGHGTRLFQDRRLQDFVRDRQVPLEINLTSNRQTGAVARLESHPLRRYFEAGIPVVLCTDSWLMTGTSLSAEFMLAHTVLGFARAEIETLVLTGFRAAFLPLPEKQRLIAEAEAAIRTLD